MTNMDITRMSNATLEKIKTHSMMNNRIIKDETMVYIINYKKTNNNKFQCKSRVLKKYIG